MARSFPPERCEPSARTLIGCYDRVRSSTSPQTVSHLPDCGLMQPQQAATSFDHLVGAGEHTRRHFEAEGFRGLEVDDQLVLVRRLHRQVGRLLTFKDAVDVAGGATL